MRSSGETGGPAGPARAGLSGRVALVTGASGGVGLHTAARLAELGARTLMASRDPARAEAARKLVLDRHPGAAVETVRLDLACLDAVRDAAQEVADRTDRLDLLVNNAGVMMPPRAGGGVPRTVDGFERQIGINHLGHFALTGRLLPLLLAGARADPDGSPARVVTVASMSYALAPRADGGGLSDPADFGLLPRNSTWCGYCRSKLANLLFAFELAHRAAGGRVPLESFATHPGTARTRVVADSVLGRAPVVGPVLRIGFKAVAQPAAKAAAPSVYAATSPVVVSGRYYGPKHFAWGTPPVETLIRRKARDHELGARLWAASVEATGVGFDELGYSAAEKR